MSVRERIDAKDIVAGMGSGAPRVELAVFDLGIMDQ